MRNVVTVVFAGGGSGGHVYPAIAVVEALKKRLRDTNREARFVRMGPRDGYAKLFLRYGVTNSPIISGKVRAYASAQNIADIPKFFVGFLQAVVKLFFIMPDAIFSKGGTGALSVVVAAWFYRIPIIIHESDAVPGRTNRASARFADKVFVSFESAARYFDAKRTSVSGTPVRIEILTAHTTKELAKQTLNFNPTEPLLFILGGSQGARRINRFIIENLGEIVRMTQVLHQTGAANLGEVQELSRAAITDESLRNRYQAVDFLDENMGVALSAADLAVARAGSASIFEIAAFGIPSILIPLAGSANGHQHANAYAYADAGAAIVIEEANLFSGIFLSQLKSLLANQELRDRMREAAARFFVPDAADRIAIEILALLR